MDAPAPAPATAPAPEVELPTMNVGVTTMSGTFYGAPFFIGIAAGLFEEQGIRVVAQEYAGGTGTVRAIAAGVEDIGLGSVGGTALAVLQGEPLRIIVEVIPNNYYITLPGSGITSLETVVGKTLHYPSEGGGGHFHLLAALESVGLAPGTDLETLLISGLGAGWTATMSGIVDASFAVDPFGATKIVQDGGVVAFRLNDYVTFPNLGFFTRTDVLRDRPDDVRLFLNAYIGVTQWIQDNLDEAAELYAAAIGVDVAIAKTTLENSPWGFEATTQEGLELVEATLKSGGQLAEGAKIPWKSGVFDQSLLDESQRIVWN